MYYRDSKAFTSGDDTGSELIIDCPWATQETTDYVLSLYQGYVYKPMQGVGVSIDGTLQLGDSFEYDNNEIQLATKIDYEFAGALVANVDAPTNVEDGYDDPWSDLVKAPLRRKVTLGDSYQGVTISREFGIETLLSPTGKEEDAIAKYYADLNKGMAFQYRDSAVDEWEDWLYFDKNERVFKLQLYSTTEDMNDQFTAINVELGRIEAEIKSRGLGNIIYNLTMGEGLDEWEQLGQLVLVEGMTLLDGMTTGLSARPVEIADSLSYTGVEFFNKGEMRSPFGFLLPRDVFSFRFQVLDFKPTNIKIYEYEDNRKYEVIEETKEEIYYSSDRNFSEYFYDGFEYMQTEDIPIAGKDKLDIHTYISPINENFILSDTFEVMGLKYGHNYPFDDYVHLGTYPLNKGVPGNPTRIDVSKMNEIEYIFIRIESFQGMYMDTIGVVVLDNVKVKTTKEFKHHKVTDFNFNSLVKDNYIEGTFMPEQNTRYVKVGIEVPTAKYNNFTTFHEMMFNQGEPKDYFESTDDAIAFAESIRIQLSNEIKDAVTEIDKITGDIYNTTVKITAPNGVEIWNNNGRGLTVYDDNNEPVISLNSTGHLIAKDATITGNLQSGSIGDWSITDGSIKSVDDDIEFNSSKKEINIGNQTISYSTNYDSLNFKPRESTGASNVSIMAYTEYGNAAVSAGNYLETVAIGTNVLGGVGVSIVTDNYSGGIDYFGIFRSKNPGTNHPYPDYLALKVELIDSEKIYINGRVYNLTRDSNGFLKAT